MPSHHCHADANDKYYNVVDHQADDADQRADAGRFTGLRPGVLPDQIENQAHQGNSATQKPPQKSAVILHLRCLLYAALGTDDRLIVNFRATLLAIRHSFILHNIRIG